MMMPVPTTCTAGYPSLEATDGQIAPSWKFLKHEVSSVNRSQKTILGLAINKPKNCTVLCFL